MVDTASDAGGIAAADGTSDSSPGISAPNDASPKSRMVEALEKSRQPKPTGESAKAPRTAKATPAPAEPENEEGDSTSDPDGMSAEADEGESDAKTVPMAAFKQRLAAETRKRTELQGKVSQLDIKNRQLTVAYNLALKEAERLESRWKEGAAFDSRDEAVARMELAEEARASGQKAQTESQKAMADAEHAELTAHFEQEITRDLEKEVARYEGIVSADDIIAECHRNPAAEIPKVAKALFERRMAAVKKREAPTAPVRRAPTTAKAAPSQPLGGPRYSNDASGMAARLRDARG